MKRKAAPQITSFFTKRSDPKNTQESNNPTTSTTPSTSANDNASKLPTQSFEAVAQPPNKHHVNPTPWTIFPDRWSMVSVSQSESVTQRDRKIVVFKRVGILDFHG